MSRQIIPRTEQNKLEHLPDGIKDFVENVAKELCQKYKDVDFYDLEFIFNRHFQYAMTMEMLRESAERL